MKWNHAIEQLKLMKHYFIASVLVFLVGMLMGALYSEQFQAFINTQLEALKRITDTLAEKPNQQWSLFWLIFWNNASKSLLVIVMGVLFGIFPLFFSDCKWTCTRLCSCSGGTKRILALCNQGDCSARDFGASRYYYCMCFRAPAWNAVAQNVPVDLQSFTFPASKRTTSCIRQSVSSD